MRTIADPHGSVRSLEPMLASGGEGKIYPLTQREEVLVKIYHPEVLQKRGAALQRKIEAMVGLSGVESLGVSWPLMSVFDPAQPQRWLGYAMRRGRGEPMSRMAHAMLYRKHFPTLNRADIVLYLLELLKLIQQLHRRQIYIGDYNLNNILCQPGSSILTLIDCDSYQVTLQGETFPCPVGSPDMTPVEHHNRPFDQVVRTRESERFSVALILFKALMLGRHPYDIVGGADPVTNLRQGNFPYGVGNRGIPTGPWYNIWSHMPFQLKSLFVTAFTEGATDPTRRPTLKEWQDKLQIYHKEMTQRGWHEMAIRPTQPKSKAYRGQRSDLSVSQSSA